jgi:hypothetical protein
MRLVPTRALAPSSTTAVRKSVVEPKKNTFGNIALMMQAFHSAGRPEKKRSGTGIWCAAQPSRDENICENLLRLHRGRSDPEYVSIFLGFQLNFGDTSAARSIASTQCTPANIDALLANHPNGSLRALEAFPRSDAK